MRLFVVISALLCSQPVAAASHPPSVTIPLLFLVESSVNMPGHVQAVANCVAEQAVTLGHENAEPAADVIRAANGMCSGAWDQTEMIWRGMSIAGRAATATEERARAQDQVFAYAFQQLLQARQKNKH